MTRRFNASVIENDKGKQYGDRRGRAEGVFRADRVGVGKQDDKRADKTRQDRRRKGQKLTT